MSWFPSSLTRDSFINLAGALLPVVVAIPCFAILARVLTPEQFSLLLLAWALVGYAGILDLGLSRAVVTVIAEVRDDANLMRQVVSTALVMVSTVSVVGAALLAIFSPNIVMDIIKVTPALQPDAVQGFRVVALTIPCLLIYLIVQGYWDGMEQFLEANMQRALSGSLPLLLATGAAFLDKNFHAAMVGLFAGRAFVLLVILLRHRFFRLFSPHAVRRDILRRLLSFGGWVTVSNTISPIMGYLDRYILAFARTANIISFYAVPSELVLKMLVAPQAITRSMYPKLIVAGSPAARLQLLHASYRLVLIVCIPATLIILAGAPMLLTLWLGEVYAAQSTLALRILALGFLACAIAQVPFCHIQARGKPAITAALQVAEVLPFVATAYYLSKHFGVPGAAAAWSARCIIDMLMLIHFSRRNP